MACWLSRREFGRQIGVEDLLAGLIEFVERPRFAEMLREFGRRLGSGLETAPEPTDLARGDRAVIRSPRLGCDPQRLQCSLKLRLREAIGGNPRAGRLRDECQRC